VDDLSQPGHPMSLEEILLLLVRIKNEPAVRKEIFKFGSSLWRELKPPLPEKVEEVLGGLVVDFAYYVDDEGIRWWDASYYGPEKLIKIIEKAFADLEAMGVSVPKD
jgi:hypothetical protein